MTALNWAHTRPTFNVDEEGGGEPVEAQDIKLMLLSQVVSICSNQCLLKYEWQLHYSQALDFLADI